MTEPGRAAHPPPKRPRLSKRVLRAWAWIAGGLALFAPLGALAAQPKIATRAAPTRPVIIRKVLRRIIVVSPKTSPAPQRIVYVGGGSGGGGSAPAPVTTTGGSAPPP
jgi:hypothetical protein